MSRGVKDMITRFMMHSEERAYERRTFPVQYCQADSNSRIGLYLGTRKRVHSKDM